MNFVPSNYAFLHGGAQGSWVWGNTLSALNQQTQSKFGRALALDVPGCGTKRGQRTEHLGLYEVARELLGDLENAGMQDVILVGHSQAGSVLPALASMRRELFRRLVYVSCSIPLPGQTVIEMMGTGLQGSNENEVGWPSDAKFDDLRQRNISMLCNDMDKSETTSFMATLGADAWPIQMYGHTDWQFDALGEVPATYVVCLRDRILPVTWQTKFAQRLRAHRLIHIDAGHQVMNSRPHALAEVLRHEAGIGRG